MAQANDRRVAQLKAGGACTAKVDADPAGGMTVDGSFFLHGRGLR